MGSWAPYTYSNRPEDESGDEPGDEPAGTGYLEGCGRSPAQDDKGAISRFGTSITYRRIESGRTDGEAIPKTAHGGFGVSSTFSRQVCLIDHMVGRLVAADQG